MNKQEFRGGSGRTAKFTPIERLGSYLKKIEVGILSNKI